MIAYNKINPEIRIEVEPTGRIAPQYTLIAPPEKSSNVVFSAGKWIEIDPHEGAAGQLERNKTLLQSENRERCRLHILKNYPVETQLSATANIYGAEFKATMIDFIAACIHAENTAFDAISTAETIEDIYAAAAEMILPEGGDQ